MEVSELNQVSREDFLAADTAVFKSLDTIPADESPSKALVQFIQSAAQSLQERSKRIGLAKAFVAAMCYALMVGAQLEKEKQNAQPTDCPSA